MEPKTIAGLIKKIRKDNHLTQKELADKYNVTYQAVSKWENGYNLPDILLLKQISKDFDISLDDIFDGEYSQQRINKRKIFHLTAAGICALLIIIGASILVVKTLNNNSNFEFKTLHSNSDDFHIVGSIAYNASKSSIYISNVDYYGGNSTEKYTAISCTLYEKDGDVTKKVANFTTENQEGITIEDFLKQVSFNVDDYAQICKAYTENSFSLEIIATRENGETISHQVPLRLSNNCNQ